MASYATVTLPTSVATAVEMVTEIPVSLARLVETVKGIISTVIDDVSAIASIAHALVQGAAGMFRVLADPKELARLTECVLSWAAIVCDCVSMIVRGAWEMIPTLVFRVLEKAQLSQGVLLECYKSVFAWLHLAREVRQPGMTPEAGCDIAAAIPAIVGLIGVVVTQSSVSAGRIKQIIEALRLFSMIEKCVGSAGAILAALFQALPDVVQRWISYLAPEAWLRTELATGGRLAVMAETVDVWSTSEGILLAASNEKRQKEILEMVLMRQAVLAEMADRKIQANPAIQQFMNALGQKLQVLLGHVDSGMHFGMSRPTPACVQLTGVPGVGKSSIVPYVVAALSRPTPDGSPSMFVWNPASDYWDGYVNQNAVVIEEFGALKDVSPGQNDPYLIFQKLISNVPVPLNMAFSEKGKAFFTSELVVLTSNNAYPNPPSMVDASALHRRRLVLVDVRPKIAYRKPGSMMLDESKLVNTTIMEALEFYIRPSMFPGIGNESVPPRAVYVPWADFLTYSSGLVNSHHEGQRRRLEALGHLRDMQSQITVGDYVKRVLPAALSGMPSAEQERQLQLVKDELMYDYSRVNILVQQMERTDEDGDEEERERGRRDRETILAAARAEVFPEEEERPFYECYSSDVSTSCTKTDGSISVQTQIDGRCSSSKELLVAGVVPMYGMEAVIGGPSYVTVTSRVHREISGAALGRRFNVVNSCTVDNRYEFSPSGVVKFVVDLAAEEARKARQALQLLCAAAWAVTDFDLPKWIASHPYIEKTIQIVTIVSGLASLYFGLRGAVRWVTGFTAGFREGFGTVERIDAERYEPRGACRAKERVVRKVFAPTIKVVRPGDVGGPDRIAAEAGVMQSEEGDVNASAIVSYRVVPAMVELIRPDKGMRVCAFGVKGTVLLAPAHFFLREGELLEEGELFQVRSHMGAVYKIPFVRANCVCMRDCDVVLYDMQLHGFSFKDNVSLFISDKDVGQIKQMDCALVVAGCPSGTEIRHGVAKAITHKSASERNYVGGGNTFHIMSGWTYKIATGPGTCGSVVVAYDRGFQQKLVGIHVAARQLEGVGYAELVTEQFLCDALGQLEKQSGRVAIVGAPIRKGIEPGDVTEEMQEGTFVAPPEGNFLKGGVTDGPGTSANNKTTIFPSVIAGQLFPVVTEPAVMSAHDPRCVDFVGEDILIQGEEKFGRGESAVFPMEMVAEACADISDELGALPRKT